MAQRYINKALCSRQALRACILACLAIALTATGTLQAAPAPTGTSTGNNHASAPVRQIIARFKPASAASMALSGAVGALTSKALSRVIPLQVPGLEIQRNMRFDKIQAGIRSSLPSTAFSSVGGFDISVFKITDDSLSVEQAIEQLIASGQVEYAEPDYPLSIDALPDDPSFSNLYGLHNTGQSGGIADADIDALEAWNTTTGDSDIIVAVIDTGVQYTHPDLAANMWTNPGEIAENGIDDDSNGYVDDVYGIDTANNDSDPMDDHSHGTHVAGTIGAVGNNGVGISGVNWDVSIMALKYLDSTGNGSTSDAIELLNYIYNMKANKGINIRLSNNSWGGGGYSQALYDAIVQTELAGILFVAAAGNDGTDNDLLPHYPSSYNLDSIIAVAATDDDDAAYTGTNDGLTSVDMAAPGVAIYSTVTGSNYGYKTGTSMATPHVAGAAALLWAQYSNLSMTEVKRALLNSGDTVSSMSGRTLTGRRLNVNNAFSCLAGGAPDPQMYTAAPLDNSIAEAGGNTLVQVSLSDCEAAVTNAAVLVTPDNGDSAFNLLDDGNGPDGIAGDGIYNGYWVPGAAGNVTLTIQASNTGAIGTLDDQRTLSVIAIPTYSADNAYPYAWSDASDGTDLGLGGTDDGDVEVQIGFDFNFYGTDYNSVWAHTNGLLKFGSENPLTFFEFLELPDTAPPNNYIAPFWDDFNPKANSGALYTKTQGSAPNRRLIVQWHDLQHFKESETGGPQGSVTFQAILYEGSNDIVIQYLDTTFDDILYDQGKNALSGIEFLDGSRGIEFANRIGGLNEQMAILYTPDTSTKKVLTINDDLVGGSVSDNEIPAQISCPQSCFGQYDNNTVIELTATAQAGYTFTGWNGADCSGTGICSISMDAHKNVSAGFEVTHEILITPTSGLVTTEAETSQNFDIVLSTQPSSVVSVALSSDDTSEGLVSHAKVTFNTQNWSQIQTITVTGQNDDLLDGNIGYNIITAPANSADPNYSGMDPTDISLVNMDDDIDTDSDLISDEADNCPNIYNPAQKDSDGDGDGDACDPDADNDGILDDADNCPLIDNPDQADDDGDGIGNACEGPPAEDNSLCIPIVTQNGGLAIICL